MRQHIEEPRSGASVTAGPAHSGTTPFKGWPDISRLSQVRSTVSRRPSSSRRLWNWWQLHAHVHLPAAVHSGEARVATISGGRPRPLPRCARLMAARWPARAARCRQASAAAQPSENDGSALGATPCPGVAGGEAPNRSEPKLSRSAGCCKSQAAPALRQHAPADGGPLAGPLGALPAGPVRRHGQGLGQSIKRLRRCVGAQRNRWLEALAAVLAGQRVRTGGGAAPTTRAGGREEM